ncbi:unnamed protein product [Urochloa humidicola]
MAMLWAVPLQRRAVEAVLCGASAPAGFSPAWWRASRRRRAGGRARHARGRIRDLALAACSMEAAELFAVRGAAADPILPLPSVQHIPDGDHPAAARPALILFQSARPCTQSTCNYIEWNGCHLRAAESLLASRRFLAWTAYSTVSTSTPCTTPSRPL